eukprot:jgi/Astpho2/3135/Aster-03418
MADLVKPAGYVLEEYSVQTPDGFLLGLYRIPFGQHESAQHARKPVVLLQHALLDCSASWVVNGPGKSLAYILADAGWDVWMSNVRGSTFSREHISLSPADTEFWSWSFDEMAAYDLPAVIDFICSATGARELGYVGHSQGTTMGFAAFSSQPELADKVSIAVMLAPVTFLGHISSRPVATMAEMETDKIFELAGAREFLPQRKSTSDMYGQLCRRAPQVCVNSIEAICGYDTDNLNTSMLPLYLAYTPADSRFVQTQSSAAAPSMAAALSGHRTAAAHVQAPASRTWYTGLKASAARWKTTPSLRSMTGRCNQDVYGSREPPVYDLSQIQIPIALFSGSEDLLSDARDIGSLTEALSPEALAFVSVQQSYAHLSFTWGTDAHLVLYPTILKLLRQYTPVGTLAPQ